LNALLETPYLLQLSRGVLVMLSRFMRIRPSRNQSWVGSRSIPIWIQLYLPHGTFIKRSGAS